MNKIEMLYNTFSHTFLHTFLHTFSNIYFLFEISWIFLSCYISFLYNSNYKLFIHDLCDKLTEKNILYVKFFQSISLNNSLIDETMNSELIKYTDSSPYTNNDINWDALMKLQTQHNFVFEQNNIPINSGMISLVYLMKNTKTQENVVVKLKRTNIEQKLNDAIEKVQFILKVLSYMPYVNSMKLADSFHKNIILLKTQLDFNEEIKNTIKMKKICSTINYVKIPEIYQEYSGEDVIVMEYIKGIHISKLNECDYEEYAKIIVKYGIFSLFINGFGHGDLHAGNILFIKNNKAPYYQIGVIDFGVVLHIHENIKNTLLNMLAELFTKEPREISKKLLEIFIEPHDIFMNIPQIHINSLICITEQIVGSILTGSKNINIGKLFEFIMNFNKYINDNDLKKYHLFLNDDLIKIQMGISMSQGVTLCLSKNNYLDIANRVVDEMFHTDLFL